MRVTALFLSVALCAGLALSPGSTAVPASSDTGDHPALERSLEDVRLALGIPGMAAAVVRDERLIWARGFGYADMENKIEATPETPFGLASVTKPIAATLIMQLVEDGAIDLDALVSAYGVDVPDGAGVTVRHLLTHTSEGVPGTVHRYNGNRYGLLGGVIEGATGRTFAELLGERVLVPVGMMDTALNPIDPMTSGGGLALDGLAEFRLALGWGEAFEHYPDVYGRLARPYQFGEQYTLIPGKYHLFHNPAAGLVSSVNDLARFDIALDQGRLLGEQARAEMFAPAIPTMIRRSDLAYGLGWYVQEFEGRQLLWHYGRWPPSTSAFYLKVPAEKLSFVVLANTDNLSVPFPDIGTGDVTGSIMALTFFRHFIFPRQHGYAIPPVDWAAEQSQLVDQLAAVDDDDARAFLERELWSFRQALFSSGQKDQAAVLMSVSREVFPDSRLRHDSSYTSTVGRFPIIPPIPSARTFVLVSKVVLVWLIVVLVALMWMIVRLVRSREGTAWDWAVWLLSAVLLGPVAVLVHRMARSPTDAGRPDIRRQAIPASLLTMTGYATAWVLAVVVLLNLGDDPNPVATLGSIFLIPLSVGLLLIRAPLLHRGGIRPFRKAVSRGAVVELITLCVGVAVLFSITLYVDNRLLATIPNPTSPYFWAMMSFMTLIGLLALVPLNSALYRRGFGIWSAAGAVQSAQSTVPRWPTFRDSWWMLLIAVVFMIAAIGLAANAFQ